MPPRAALAAALLALAAPAWPQSPPSSCPTLESCLELLGTPMRDSERMALQARIQSFGPVAVEALVSGLDHSDPKIASAAGLALAQFPAIDRRHLPRLIRAFERGNGWLPRAIAATGTEEALAYLQDLTRKDPDFSNQSQVHMALARFNERLRPFVVAELETCGRGGPEKLCQGLFSTLGHVEGGYPEWAVEPVAALARAPAAADSVRWLASDFVIRRRHPLGREILIGRLRTAAKRPSRNEWEAKDALRQLAGYGVAAADLGPLVSVHLGSASADVKAQAALTLGRIGANGEASKLAALEPGFDDDWLLAYNSVEALAQLGASPVRPLLERVAAGHWHRGVRNNAERALNRLAGGEFARPGVAGDPTPYSPRGDDGEEYLYFGELRYAGDLPTRCALDPKVAIQPVRQDPPATISWPERGARRLQFQPLTDPAAREVRATLDRMRSSARVPFRQPLRSGGFLTGYDQGEWGGAIVHVGADGTIDQLVDGNAKGAFRIGKRLYVVQGLSHLVLSRGTLSVFAGDPPRLIRATRLPAEPYEILATDRHAILVRTRSGDLAIREDGRLADPESLGLCAKAEP